MAVFLSDFRSLWIKISSKNSVLVVSAILRLFVNIYSKYIFRIFFSSSRNYIKFRILWKKIWASEGISFWNYRVEKLGLLTCLKSFVLEHLWMVNMLKGPKGCLNLHASIFVIIFDYSERKSAQKILIW